MKKLSLFLLMICCLSGSAMENYDDLFQRSFDLQDALEEFNSVKEHTVPEHRNFKMQALCYYQEASDYIVILEDGLSSDNKLYREMTLLLLLETFTSYIFKYPDLSDVMRVIQSYKFFTESQIIFLKRWALIAYSSPNDYHCIMSDDAYSDNFEYKKATTRLLLETFGQYLARDPNLEDALSLLDAHRLFLSEHEYMELKKQLLKAFPELKYFFPILKSGLSSEKSSIKQLSGKLALENLETHLDNKLEESHFLDAALELSRTGIIISDAPNIKAHFDSILKAALQTQDFDLNLEFLSSKDFADIPLLISFGELLLEYNPNAQKALLAECEKSENIELRNVCLALFRDLGLNPSSSEIYKNLIIYRHYKLNSQEFYKKNNRYLEAMVLSTLEKDIESYYALQKQQIVTINNNLKENSEIPKFCPICLGEVSSVELYKFEGCGHPICKQCLKDHVNCQLTEHSNNFICTAPNCGVALSDKDFEEAGLNLDERFKIYKNSVFIKINQIPGVLLCSNEFCPDAFVKYILDKEFLKGVSDTSKNAKFDCHKKCSTCDNIQCLKCGYPHQGLSCKKAMKLRAKNIKGEAKMMAGKNKQFKFCPNCKVMIKKTGGCKFMNCKKCNQPFNWNKVGK